MYKPAPKATENNINSFVVGLKTTNKKQTAKQQMKSKSEVNPVARIMSILKQ